jgi:hypothetical protein
VADNLVINNSDHNFSSHADNLRATQNEPQVVPTSGTDAAVLKNERAQLESGSLAATGRGLNANFQA